MNPTGSPPTCVSSLSVAGLCQTSSELCSAWTSVTRMPGPSGVTVPLLFMRMARVAGSSPRVMSDWHSPAGA